MKSESIHTAEASGGPMMLVAEVYDRETESIIQTCSFAVHDVVDLCLALGIDTFDSWASYDLDRMDVETLNSRYGLGLHPDGQVRLRRRMSSEIDEYPYVVHTNRELLLMLQGRKPLSVFADEGPSEEDAPPLFPEAKFDTHVAAGRFVKHEYVESVGNGHHRVRWVFYALPDEGWRIKAYNP